MRYWRTWTSPRPLRPGVPRQRQPLFPGNPYLATRCEPKYKPMNEQSPSPPSATLDPAGAHANRGGSGLPPRVQRPWRRSRHSQPRSQDPRPAKTPIAGWRWRPRR